MTNFIWPIMGGFLIGLSAILLFLFIGRIAGISGIIWGMVTTKKSPEGLWRWLFIVGIIVGAFLYHVSTGAPAPATNNNFLLAAVAGLFVGTGVKLGNGCTSGHGVCGIGRLSFRSLVATVSFMAVAIATVALFNQFLA
ncbi:MAG: YeeE/YedE family protein [Acidiferrobacterales bacterium]|nr:YeeE/YedE family protein [Acidiferrobacterales bacterium]